MNLFTTGEDYNMCGAFDKQTFGGPSIEPFGIPGFNISSTVVPLPRNPGMPMAFQSQMNRPPGVGGLTVNKNEGQIPSSFSQN